MDRAVEEESAVTLDCVLSTSSYNITIQWMVNSTQLTSEPHEVSGNTYTIPNFNENANGGYYCLATNGDWVLRSSTAVVRVAVLESPYDGGTETVFAEENSVVSINCIPDYTVYPLGNIDIEWRYVIGQSLFDLVDDQNNMPIAADNGTLILRELTEPGKYLCRIRHSQYDTIPSITYTTVVNINGEGPVSDPHIIIKPQDMVVEALGSVIFTCIAVGG